MYLYTYFMAELFSNPEKALLKEQWRQVKDHPYDFDGWTGLLKLVEKLVGLLQNLKTINKNRHGAGTKPYHFARPDLVTESHLPILTPNDFTLQNCITYRHRNGYCSFNTAKNLVENSSVVNIQIRYLEKYLNI